LKRLLIQGDADNMLAVILRFFHSYHPWIDLKLFANNSKCIEIKFAFQMFNFETSFGANSLKSIRPVSANLQQYSFLGSKMAHLLVGASWVMLRAIMVHCSSVKLNQVKYSLFSFIPLHSLKR
jgi:hypothetical protein